MTHCRDDDDDDDGGDDERHGWGWCWRWWRCVAVSRGVDVQGVHTQLHAKLHALTKRTTTQPQPQFNSPDTGSSTRPTPAAAHATTRSHPVVVGPRRPLRRQRQQRAHRVADVGRRRRAHVVVAVGRLGDELEVARAVAGEDEAAELLGRFCLGWCWSWLLLGASVAAQSAVSCMLRSMQECAESERARFGLRFASPPAAQQKLLVRIGKVLLLHWWHSHQLWHTSPPPAANATKQRASES